MARISFIEYVNDDDLPSECLKTDVLKDFRSMKEVLKCTRDFDARESEPGIFSS